MREKLCLSDGAFGCCEHWVSAAALCFKLIRFDWERSTAKNYCLDQFSVLLPCFFTPPQRLPWLSAKSILPLVGDNEHVHRASNEHRCSWAPQLNTVTSCRHFWGRQKREALAFRDQLKTHIQIVLKRSPVRHSFTALPRPHSFTTLSDLTQLFSTVTNKQIR